MKLPLVLNANPLTTSLGSEVLIHHGTWELDNQSDSIVVVQLPGFGEGGEDIEAKFPLTIIGVTVVRLQIIEKGKLPITVYMKRCPD